MSCVNPCFTRNWIPLCRIHAILNTLWCSLCENQQFCNIPKQEKFRAFECAVNRLSRFSVDPRGSYTVFDGIVNNDPSKILAVYIDNVRGEYDPNLSSHRVYLVAFCMFGDMDNICRTLILPYKSVSGAADVQSGGSKVENSVAIRTYRAQPGLAPDGSIIQPIGIQNPLGAPFGGPLGVPGAAFGSRSIYGVGGSA